MSSAKFGLVDDFFILPSANIAAILAPSPTARVGFQKNLNHLARVQGKEGVRESQRANERVYMNGRMGIIAGREQSFPITRFYLWY